MKCLPKHPNFINIRYLPLRHFETAWCFLMCTLSIRRETITDNVTALAMVPTTMPANAPLLIPELGELPTSVTLVKVISIKYSKPSNNIHLIYEYMKLTCPNT